MRNSLIINGGWRYLRVCRSHNESEFKHTLALMMREIGRQYPDAGYGDRFFDWPVYGTINPIE